MQQVEPEALALLWPAIERGLSIIRRKCGRVNWTPEKVRERIEAGHAGLFICDDGFLVLEQDTEPVSELRFLNVWLAWFKPDKAKARRSELIAWLDEMKQTTKSEWVQFSSPRAGWMGLEPDFQPYITIWRR